MEQIARTSKTLTMAAYSAADAKKAAMLMTPAMAKAYDDATRPLWLVNSAAPDPTFTESLPLLDAPYKPKARSFDLSALKLPAAAINFALPPLIFLLAAVPLLSVMHYRLGAWVYLFPLIAAIPLFLACISLVKARRKGIDARWPILSVLTFGAALAAGVFVGELTWHLFMESYWVVEAMKAYPNVSPVDVPGLQVMDAGRVHFSNTSKVDIGMTMSFTDWHIYCVAPIVDSSVPQMETYDYWAVGVDCCNTEDLSFRCGEIDSATARSGLREINEAHRNYFRLAVQQAEAEYNINSEHPLFFYWVQDPLKLMGLFYEAGIKHFMCACVMHFAANTAAIVMATVLFIRVQDTAGLATLGY